MKNLKGWIEKYRANIDLQKKLDQSLLEFKEKKEWIDNLTDRALKIHSISKENEEFLAYINSIVSKDLNESEIEELFLEVHSLYWDEYADNVVLEPMLEKLLEHYEATNNTEKKIIIYAILYYEENEIRNRADGIEKMSLDYLEKLVALREHYASLDKEARKRFFAAYYNIIVVGVDNDAISADDSYLKLQEMRQFWNSDVVQQLDGEDEDFINLVERIGIEWLVVEKSIENANETTKKEFSNIAQHYFNKQSVNKSDILNVNSELYAAYLHSLVFHNWVNFEEALDEFLYYYKKKLELIPTDGDIDEEDFYFIVNAPLTIERWVHNISDESKKNDVIQFLKDTTKSTWYSKMLNCAPTFLNELMADWCFKILRHMKTQEEKEECIYQLLGKRQLPTYLHSVMVKNIAIEIYDEAIKANPKIFANCCGMNENQVREYIINAAMLHDLGKTKITDIVNMQTRRLSDREFIGIKRHTIYGAQMIKGDFILEKYYDVIVGHHKFYNGKGGYPDEFDNTQSPYRCIIDLITLADCLDAATDRFGRNYKFAKTIDEVLNEFEQDRDVRYNPELVDVIINSKELQAKLEYIISEGRTDIIYKAYLESCE